MGQVQSVGEPADVYVDAGGKAWLPFFPGFTFKVLRVSAETGTWTVLIRSEAGAAFPTHTHLGAGEYYVVSGLMEVRGGVQNGGITAQTGSLSDYAASFYQNLSTRSNTVTQAQTTQDNRLQEAQSRMASNSGVSLDEELTNLTTYQQAYAAGARLLSVVDKLYDTLLQIQ